LACGQTFYGVEQFNNQVAVFRNISGAVSYIFERTEVKRLV